VIFSAPIAIGETSTEKQIQGDSIMGFPSAGRKKPQIQTGDVVTVEYDHYVHTLEPPVGARIARVRHDLDWENVLEDFKHEPPDNKNGMHLCAFFNFENSKEIICKKNPKLCANPSIYGIARRRRWEIKIIFFKNFIFFKF
jgi:hypothetical protein